MPEVEIVHLSIETILDREPEATARFKRFQISQIERVLLLHHHFLPVGDKNPAFQELS